jgi:hypothetical protein
MTIDPIFPVNRNGRARGSGSLRTSGGQVPMVIRQNDKRLDQAAAPDNRPQEDPAEGSRDTVEHELDRHRQSGSEAPHGEAKRARDDLQEQVKEEIEFPERGSV